MVSVVLLPGQPNGIHELLALTKTLTLFGYIPYASLIPFFCEVEIMEDMLQFCLCLLAPLHSLAGIISFSKFANFLLLFVLDRSSSSV